jgi:hypothetical protein
MTSQVQTGGLERDNPRQESGTDHLRASVAQTGLPRNQTNPQDLINELLMRHLVWFANYGWR